MRPSFIAAVLAFARRRFTSIVVVTIVATAIGVWLVARTTFDADVLRLLPRRSPAVRDFQQFLKDFGSLDHLYVAFDAEDGIGDSADFVDAYVDRLRHAPEIESVDAQLFEEGKDWNYLADRELYLLGPKDAAAALTRFQPPRLDAELSHARDLLTTPSTQVKGLVQQDPLGLLTMLRDRMQRDRGFGTFDMTQEGYVSQDGRSRLVVVKPKGAPFDTNFCKALFARLSTIESNARREAATDATAVRVQAAGAYRVSLEAEALIRRETIVNSIGSLLALLVVMFAVFRTPWILVCGFAPLAVASVLTLGINGRIRGTLSPATSGSAGMLFGLGIDGVVLLYLRYVEERQTTGSVDEAVQRIAGTASSVVLAQATTAATFLALLIIDFPSLQDLGGLVGLGILICCGLTLLMLPGMLPRNPTASPLTLRAARGLGSFVTRQATPIVWCSILATLALGIAARRLTVDTSLDRLQAQTEGTRLEDEVAERFGLPKDVLLVTHEDADIERLLEADERLRSAIESRLPSVAASGIGFLLPSAREQAQVAALLRGAQLTAGESVRHLESAAERAGFRTNAFAPFEDRLSRLLDPDERITYDGLEAHGLDAIASRFIARHRDRFQSVTYLYAPRSVDLGALRSTIASVDAALHLTGLPVINDELRRGFMPEFLKAITLGTVAVALLVFVVFRSVRHTLLALVPTAVGFVWSAGLLALWHVELDLFSMFATVTFIGIAVDYGIYVLYRYLLEPANGVGPRDKKSAMNGVVTKTGAAIMIAGVAALIGFGTSINSSYRPLHVFGIVSLVTLSCCLIASLVFLPALVCEIER